MNHRHRVLSLLGLLLIITYLDRVCISVAGPRMQEDLHISPLAWGWVTGMFTLAYGLFEVPSGALGDRIGPRRVLTRIVLWWSAFTALTGVVTSYYPLLLIRFLFGAGEAGAYPNASVAIARWFPLHERGRALGTTLMASQIGGALTPLLVVPIQSNYGWRATFFIFGSLGVFWSALWYWWFRDSPAEKPGVPVTELQQTHHLTLATHTAFPWRNAFRSPHLWALMGIAFCYIYTFYFFQSWFHTYLVKAQGYSENALLLSSLPYLVAIVTNFTGGLASSALVTKLGFKRASRILGAVGLGTAAICIVAVLFATHWLAALILLSLAYGAITFQQPTMFAACLNIGGPHGGAVVGAMNTAAQCGALTSSVLFGYIVQYTGNYNIPFIPMAVFLLIGAWLWLKTDTSHQLPA
jgi:ACS family glucarate transporter-like MFS transporter